MAPGPLSGVAARWVDVHRDLAGRRVLDGLRATVEQGQVLALLGPNGAGKTTAISVLIGLRRPDGGHVEVLGGDPRHHAVRRRLGWVPQTSSFPHLLTVGEVAGLVAAHHDRAVDPVGDLAPLGLDGLLDRRVGGLSGGQARRLSCAIALLGRPDLLVLDEPTTGVDPENRWRLWERVADPAAAAAGRAVVLATNDLHEAEALAERVVVIRQGRAVFSGSVAELRQRWRAVARVSVRVPDADQRARVRTWAPDLAEAPEDPGRVRGTVADGDALVRALVDHDIAFAGLEVRPPTLDEMVREGWDRA